jgi:hypothetical protein
MTLNPRELGTTLAALRLWQQFNIEHPDEGELDIDFEWLLETANDGGTLELTNEEIDELCSPMRKLTSSARGSMEERPCA